MTCPAYGNEPGKKWLFFFFFRERRARVKLLNTEMTGGESTEKNTVYF